MTKITITDWNEKNLYDFDEETEEMFETGETFFNKTLVYEDGTIKHRFDILVGALTEAEGDEETYLLELLVKKLKDGVLQT